MYIAYCVTNLINGEKKISDVTITLPGLCGGSASGKTTVAKRIIEALDVPWVSLLSMDSFYKVTPSCS